jgi:hypothetical protein
MVHAVLHAVLLGRRVTVRRRSRISRTLGRKIKRRLIFGRFEHYPWRNQVVVVARTVGGRLARRGLDWPLQARLEH